MKITPRLASPRSHKRVAFYYDGGWMW